MRRGLRRESAGPGDGRSVEPRPRRGPRPRPPRSLGGLGVTESTMRRRPRARAAPERRAQPSRQTASLRRWRARAWSVPHRSSDRRHRRDGARSQTNRAEHAQPIILANSAEPFNLRVRTHTAVRTVTDPNGRTRGRSRPPARRRVRGGCHHSGQASPPMTGPGTFDFTIPWLGIAAHPPPEVARYLRVGSLGRSGLLEGRW